MASIPVIVSGLNYAFNAYLKDKQQQRKEVSDANDFDASKIYQHIDFLTNKLEVQSEELRLTRSKVDKVELAANLKTTFLGKGN